MRCIPGYRRQQLEGGRLPDNAGAPPPAHGSPANTPALPQRYFTGTQEETREVLAAVGDDRAEATLRGSQGTGPPYAGKLPVGLTT